MRFPMLAALTLTTVMLAGSAAQADSILDLTFDGTFTDADGHSFTTIGNPTLNSTTVAPGSTDSLQIPGTTGNYLSFAPSNDFNLGANNFTLSASVLFTGPISQYAGAVGLYGTTPSYQLYFLSQTNDTVTPAFSFLDNTGQHTFYGSPFSLNTWEQVTVERVGSTLSLLVDGTTENTITVDDAFNNSTNPLWIGEAECYGDSVCWQHGSTFYLDAISLTETEAPEPATLFLLGAGLAGVTVFRLRRGCSVASQAA